MRSANVGGADEMTTIEIIKQVGAISAAVGAVITTITLLIKYRKQIGEWLDRRKEWKVKLDDHEVRIINVEEDVTEIKGDLKSLRKDFNTSLDDSRDYRRASLGDKIFTHTEKYIDQGYVTQLQLQNYQICIERYKRCVSEIEAETDLILGVLLEKVKQLPVRKEHPQHEQ
jgi:hypothetical protein